MLKLFKKIKSVKKCKVYTLVLIIKQLTQKKCKVACKVV